jgi:transcriptional repressor NrdR
MHRLVHRLWTAGHPPRIAGNVLCTGRWPTTTESTGAKSSGQVADVRCPYCAADDDRVVDSRAAEDGAAIRRRRACRACGQRFSTYERQEQTPLAVRKRNGSTEPFSREKVVAGISRATKNSAVDPEAVRRAAAQVEARVRATGRREVGSDTIGTEVLDALRALDPVAYVRFVSVYRGFTSPEDFVRELATLEKQAPPKPPGPQAGRSHR